MLSNKCKYKLQQHSPKSWNAVNTRVANVGPVNAGTVNTGAAIANAGHHAESRWQPRRQELASNHTTSTWGSWAIWKPWDCVDQQSTTRHSCVLQHTNNKLCPHDSYKDVIKMEETCQLAPPATKLLGLPDHKNNMSISLTGWVMAVLLHICNTRMDAVFLHLQVTCNTHLYQLTWRMEPVLK